MGKFLNQETAVQYGVEKYAIEFNCPVFYVSLDKVKKDIMKFHYI